MRDLAVGTGWRAGVRPVGGATALGMGGLAFLLALPGALFATLGFMLPVSTPPNAVSFGSGEVQIGHMLRAGVILDIVGIFIVFLREQHEIADGLTEVAMMRMAKP